MLRDETLVDTTEALVDAFDDGQDVDARAEGRFEVVIHSTEGMFADVKWC